MHIDKEDKAEIERIKRYVLISAEPLLVFGEIRRFFLKARTIPQWKPIVEDTEFMKVCTSVLDNIFDEDTVPEILELITLLPRQVRKQFIAAIEEHSIYPYGTYFNLLSHISDPKNKHKQIKER